MSEETHLFEAVRNAKTHQQVNTLSQVLQDLEWSKRKLEEAKSHIQNLEDMTKNILRSVEEKRDFGEIVIHNWTGPVLAVSHSLTEVRNLITKKR